MTNKRDNSTVLPSAPDPVNERPAGMSHAEYKKHRAETNQKLKDRKRGFLVHKAQEVKTDEHGHVVGKRWKKGQTLTGSTKTLQVV